MENTDSGVVWTISCYDQWRRRGRADTRRLLILERQFQTGDVVTVAWEAQIRWSAWYRDSIAIERGPLVFALNMQENWKGFRECGGVTDYEVTSDTPWNYALAKEGEVKVLEQMMGRIPFQKNHPPVVLKVKARNQDGIIGHLLQLWNIPGTEAPTGAPSDYELDSQLAEILSTVNEEGLDGTKAELWQRI